MKNTSNKKNANGTHPADIDSIAKKANFLWKKSQRSWIELARYCALQNAKLTRPEVAQLQELLDFGKSTWSKLVGIGSDKKFMDNDIVNVVFGMGYSLLYELTKLSADEVRRGIVSGLLSADSTRDEIVKYMYSLKPSLSEHLPKRKNVRSATASKRQAVIASKAPPKPSCPPRFYAAITLAPGYSAEDAEEVDKALAKLCSNKTIVVSRWDDDFTAKCNRWHDTVTARFYNSCRKAMLDAIEDKLKGTYRRPKETREAFYDRCGFPVDEYSFQDDLLEEGQLESMMDNLCGSDAYETLLREVRDSIPPPKPRFAAFEEWSSDQTPNFSLNSPRQLRERIRRINESIERDDAEGPVTADA